jgi:inner membrane transporter RhtA
MPASSRFTLPPVPAVLLSIISVQAGAAIAKGLFPALGAATTASLRIGLAALILLVVVRPSLGRLTALQWRAVVPYGLSLGLMNFLFYLSLARIPLGLAVTLEFIGPLGLALAGSRRWIDALWAVLAGLGIALITPWHGTGLDPLGLLYAALAGGAWVVYIVLGRRTAAVLPGPTAVAVGMVFGALLVLPFGLGSGHLPAITLPLLGLGAALALFSSAIPFTLEMQALKKLSAANFSILMSLEPVAAALSGWWLLHEQLTLGQGLAVLLIAAASAGATLTARRPATAVGAE